MVLNIYPEYLPMHTLITMYISYSADNSLHTSWNMWIQQYEKQKLHWCNTLCIGQEGKAC